MNEVSLSEIEAFVKRFSYRPGWQFYVRGGYRENLILWAMCPVQDVHTERQALLHATRPLPYLDHHNWRNQVAYEMWHLIEDLESHERLEWLKFDGEWLWPPHVEGVSHRTPGGPPFPVG